MRLRKYNKIFGMLSLIATTLLLSGCDMALMNPKGQVGLEQRSLILTALGLMLIVVIPVIIMTIAFAWKFRASNEKSEVHAKLVAFKQNRSRCLDGPYHHYPHPWDDHLENYPFA
ncbi:hypothetical protein OS42_15120 [Dickeya oryzae]